MKKPTLNKPNIEQTSLESLIPYARNARKHSDEQVAQLAASIREFGFNNPVLIDSENGIIAGHGRVLAARKLGLETVPCIRLTHLSDTQRRAYILADNRLAELGGGWDQEMLAIELSDLHAENFEVDLTGFSESDIDSFLQIQDTKKIDSDKEPETPTDSVSAFGDIWTLGKHRVMCGDATNSENVKLLLSGADWDRLIFDPPYDQEALYETAMLPPKDNAKLVTFWDFKRFGIAAKSAIEFGWSPLYELIWDNVTSWYTPNRPLARHKACGIFGDDPNWNFDSAIIRDGKIRKSKTISNTRGECNYVPLDGAVHLRTIESFPTTSENGGHSHSKPIKWIEAIFNGIGGNCYLDLFGGSGTTIIACESIKSNSFTMEINPQSVDVIILRWQAFTGKQAFHSEGKTFDEMKQKRVV